MKRQRHDGLRKICKCLLRSWPRCEHPWYFSFKPKGGARVRVSIDRYAGHHVTALENAKTFAANLRTAVAAGEYPPPAVQPAAAPAVVTFRTAADRFLEAVPVIKGKNQGKPRGANDQQKLAALCAWTATGHEVTVGQCAAGDVTEDVYEAFVQQLRTKGRAAATVSKYIQLIKALDRWLAKKGYRTAPAVTGDSDILRRTKGTRRDRRLEPDTITNGKVTREGEERRLIRAANPWLQRLILAAIETGCRRGELLNLRWADVDLTRGAIVVQGASNKTGEGRRLPISPKLRSVLDMLKLDPKGKERPGDHYVFGNTVGEPVASSKKAWETAVLKAHGYEPVWTDKKGLAPASRRLLQAIDLHFHDLRHECGSRLLESGWPLHHVQGMLGHADVKQTATYLNVTASGLHDSMARFGTTPPWQSVAIEAPIEPQPDCHDAQAPQPQATIN